MLKRIFFLTSILAVSSPIVFAKQSNSTSTPPETIAAPSQASFPASWNKDIGVSTYYDEELGMIADVKYKHAFNQSNAGAIELEGGERIGRINATFGRAFTTNNRIKLSVERLEEKLDFDFDSGTIKRWDGQNAIGADYQYVLSHGLINSFHLGGYYTHANSKSLSDRQFIYDGSTLTNTRRIAGGNSGNASTGVDFQLWPQSRLHVNLEYDVIHYDMKNDLPGDGDDDDPDLHGLGTSFGLHQVILPQLKASVNTELRKPYKDYQGELSYLLPSPKKTQLALSYITDYMHSLSTHRNFFSNGVRLNISWDQSHTSTPKPHYTLAKTPKMTLADWAAMPAVRMTEVLAIVDEVSRDAGGDIIPIGRMMTDCCPAIMDESGEMNIRNEGGGFYETEDEQWFTAQRANTDANITTFDGAKETTRGNASVIECTYSTDTRNHTVTLVSANANEHFEVETPIGNNWIQSGNHEVCYGHWNNNTGTGDFDPTACEFEFDGDRFERATPENNRKIVNYRQNKSKLHQVNLQSLRAKLRHH